MGFAMNSSSYLDCHAGVGTIATNSPQETIQHFYDKSAIQWETKIPGKANKNRVARTENEDNLFIYFCRPTLILVCFCQVNN